MVPGVAQESTRREPNSCIICEEAVIQMFPFIFFPDFVFLLFKIKSSSRTDPRPRPGLEQFVFGAFRNLTKFDRGMNGPEKYPEKWIFPFRNLEKMLLFIAEVKCTQI